MADNKSTIEIEVQTKEAVNGLKQLRQELKEAKAAALNGDGAAAKRVAELTDKFDDLKDSVKTLQGSGLEKANASLGLLKDGFTNLDFDKIKVGLGALKSAFAATGILLLVQGVTYLIENFDELSQGSGLLARALRFVGDVIDNITDAVYTLTDALGLTNSELDKQGEAIKTNADKATEALGRQTAEYDRQIAIAKASGKNAVDLEIAKQQAIIDTNKALVEQTIAYVRNGGVLTEEQNKLLTQQLESIKNAVAQQDVIRLQERQKDKEQYAKLQEEKKKVYLKRLEDEKQAELERQRSLNEALKSLNEIEKFDKLKALDDENQQIELKMSESFMRRKALAEFYDKEAANFSLNLAMQTAQNMQQISDAYFAIKMAKAKKGSEEEEKLARKQFQINKALSIQSAIISGIQGVVNALSAQWVIPEPFATIGRVASAVSVGIATAANVAKIASTQFNPSGGGGGATPTISTPTSGVPSAPTISTPNNNISGTQFDEQGNTIRPQTAQPTVTVKAQVVESDMTEIQTTVQKYKTQSTF